MQENDYTRLLDLMEKCRDQPVGLADAPLVLAAEKTKYWQILTLGSDFLFYLIGDNELNILNELANTIFTHSPKCRENCRESPPATTAKQSAQPPVALVHLHFAT